MERLVKLTEVDNPEGYISQVLPWVHEAGNPYYDWFFGGPAHARETLHKWMQRSTSEISIQRVILLFNSVDEPIGGFIAMSMVDLAQCRKADTLALLQGASKDDRHNLMEKLKKTQGMFSSEDTAPAFYLSKMGVLPKFQKQGYGKVLMAAYLEEGKKAGFKRYRLDVTRDNQAAQNLYSSFGFQVGETPENSSMPFCFISMEKRL